MSETGLICGPISLTLKQILIIPESGFYNIMVSSCTRVYTINSTIWFPFHFTSEICANSFSPHHRCIVRCRNAHVVALLDDSRSSIGDTLYARRLRFHHGESRNIRQGGTEDCGSVSARDRRRSQTIRRSRGMYLNSFFLSCVT
jgi:hypothetical protein